MSSGDIFESLLVPEPIASACSERAFVQHLLDFEAALAAATASRGLISERAAEEISAACEAGDLDLAALGAEGRAAANPLLPVLGALRERLGEEARGAVHWGATSQDAIDTAFVLLARDCGGLAMASLERLASACAVLAERHRETPMAARTLLQQALPTTFGLTAAGWLAGVEESRELLGERLGRLALQFGGGAGTLAALGGEGPAVAAELARRLELPEPALPWHGERTRFAALGAALAIAAGAAAKIGVDVALLSQTEVGELAEPGGEGRGGSSTMPHKRNPVGAVAAIVAGRRATAASASLIAAMPGELHRAAGAWQSEWQPLRELLGLAGGATASMAEVLEGLGVDAERMRANLRLSGGAIMAESLVFALAPSLGRGEAERVVGEVVSGQGEGDLAERLGRDPAIAAALGGPEGIARALDPSAYLGSAGAFIDRALEQRGAEALR